MTPEQHIREVVIGRMLKSGELVQDYTGRAHRPEPTGSMRDFKAYERYLNNVVIRHYCPICDTPVGHAPKCAIAVALEKAKQGMDF